MENEDCTEQEKFGILFIYEHDGFEWTKYMMNSLEAEPYNIRCLSSLCWDLGQEIIERCLVKVLVLTPDMESKASELNLDLLQPYSAHSCVIECNGLLSKTNMPTWNNVYTLRETLENQRGLFENLISLYEGITGNQEIVNADTENVLIMDVVPPVLYPGQNEVYVIFNYEEEADVTVSVEGITDRLSTRKCTKTVHIFEMPHTHSGQKYVSIYVGDQVDPIFSTNVIIITPENLAESLTLNLKRILSPNNHEPKKTPVFSRSSSFDPFSEPQCTNDTLMKCWSTLKEYLRAEVEPAKPYVEFRKRDKVQDKPKVGEEETAPVTTKSLSKWTQMKGFIAKAFGYNDSPVNEININKRKSRRILMTKTNMSRGPRLPRKRSKTT